MPLTAEFRLESYQLPLVDVAAAVPELTLELVDGEQPESGPFVCFIRATGSSFTGLESALDRSPWCSEYVLITETESMRVYRVMTPSRRPSAIEQLRLGRTYTECLTFFPDGWRLRQQFADRDELSAFRESCSSMAISFHLERLHDTGVPDTELPGLTDKQHEALATAHELGYFSVPRRASMADVAETLDRSVSALAERMHRAQSHLADHYCHSTRYSTPDSSGSE